MFPCLAHRPWHVFFRVSLNHRASLSQWAPRSNHYSFGWQSGGVHSWWFYHPDFRVAALGLNKVQYYSTSGTSKDDPPKSASKDTTENILTGPAKSAASLAAQGVKQTQPFQVKVRAVLKKRDYGAKYTQNNFVTAVRAMNEFCLKPSDLEQLRKIRRRSPHDDTEAFTVFLRSDVEAKALDVWGSLEALARERNLRKEVEREYQENIFRNQQLLKEYKDFGETPSHDQARGRPFCKGLEKL